MLAISRHKIDKQYTCRQHPSISMCQATLSSAVSMELTEPQTAPRPQDNLGTIIMCPSSPKDARRGRISSFLQLHVQECKRDDCQVPDCVTVRDHFRTSQQQQQKINNLMKLNSKIRVVTEQWKRDSQIFEADSLVRQSKKVLMVS